MTDVPQLPGGIPPRFYVYAVAVLFLIGMVLRLVPQATKLLGPLGKAMDQQRDRKRRRRQLLAADQADLLQQMDDRLKRVEGDLSAIERRAVDHRRGWDEEALALINDLGGTIRPPDRIV